MPRKKKSVPAAAIPLSLAADSHLTPVPPTQLHVTPTIIPRGKVLDRVHSEQFTGAQFNPGLKGNARFSPIRTTAGAPIPTIYAADTF